MSHLVNDLVLPSPLPSPPLPSPPLPSPPLPSPPLPSPPLPSPPFPKTTLQCCFTEVDCRAKVVFMSHLVNDLVLPSSLPSPPLPSPPFPSPPLPSPPLPSPPLPSPPLPSPPLPSPPLPSSMGYLVRTYLSVRAFSPSSPSRGWRMCGWVEIQEPVVLWDQSHPQMMSHRHTQLSQFLAWFQDQSIPKCHSHHHYCPDPSEGQTRGDQHCCTHRHQLCHCHI